MEGRVSGAQTSLPFLSLGGRTPGSEPGALPLQLPVLSVNLPALFCQGVQTGESTQFSPPAHLPPSQIWNTLPPGPLPVFLRSRGSYCTFRDILLTSQPPLPNPSPFCSLLRHQVPVYRSPISQARPGSAAVRTKPPNPSGFLSFISL